ncbi:MAG: 4Fe-4S binding protein [Candidatus Helarchaeota archaeon]
MSISDDYRGALIKIAKKLSLSSMSIPKDENGGPTNTYIEYLSLLYNPEEAEIVQELEVFPQNLSLNKLKKKIGRDKKYLMEILDPLGKKGFVFKMGKTYAIPVPLEIFDLPFMIKEHYTGDNAKKLAKLAKKFFEEENYYKIWETTEDGIPRTRILTVSEKIEPGHEIIPLDEVYNIIEQNSSFALVPCPCRNKAEVLGIRKCKNKYPIHNCVLLGAFAEKVIAMEDPIARRSSKVEVKQVIDAASKVGLVHTTDNFMRSNILCSCCECCCVMLAGITRPGLNNPRAIAKANYIAVVNEKKCSACELCLTRCKFEAINIEDTAKIDMNRCMGCGLCAVTCPNEAIMMRRLEREEMPKKQIYI